MQFLNQNIEHSLCSDVIHTSQAHIVLVPKAVAQLPAIVENLQQLGILKHRAQPILPALLAHPLNIKHEDILSCGKKQESKRTSPAQESALARNTNLSCSSDSFHGLFIHIPHLLHKVKARRCEDCRWFVLVWPKPLSDASLDRTPA